MLRGLRLLRGRQRDVGVGRAWCRLGSISRARHRNSVTPMVDARLGAEAAANLTPQVARALGFGYEVNALRCNYLAGAPSKSSIPSRPAAFLRLQSRVLRSRLPRTATLRCGCSETWISWCGWRFAACGRGARASRLLVASYRADAIESGFFPTSDRLLTRGQCRGSPLAVVARLLSVCSRRRELWNRTADLDMLGRRVRVLGPADSILFRPATAPSMAG